MFAWADFTAIMPLAQKERKLAISAWGRPSSPWTWLAKPGASRSPWDEAAASISSSPRVSSLRPRASRAAAAAMPALLCRGRPQRSRA